MPQGKPVEIATRSFPSRKEATQYFRDMLNRYRPGDRVSHEDFLDLLALLERHPEYTQKVGCGIDHMEVMRAGPYPTNCFRIVRHDGVGTDFSYPTCIAGKPPSRKREVIQSFRGAVDGDIRRARDEFFSEYAGSDGTAPCAVTGKWIARTQGHIDHRPPMTFEVIVTTFLAHHGMDYDQVPITEGKDEQVAPSITDEELSDKFRSYHRDVANLDFVESTEHLGQSSRHRIKGGRISLS